MTKTRCIELLEERAQQNLDDAYKLSLDMMCSDDYEILTDFEFCLRREKARTHKVMHDEAQTCIAYVKNIEEVK